MEEVFWVHEFASNFLSLTAVSLEITITLHSVSSCCSIIESCPASPFCGPLCTASNLLTDFIEEFSNCPWRHCQIWEPWISPTLSTQLLTTKETVSLRVMAVGCLSGGLVSGHSKDSFDSSLSTVRNPLLRCHPELIHWCGIQPSKSK